MPISLANGTYCRDWRACDAQHAVPLIEAEVRAWRDTLSWDVADAWTVVEPARQAGQLPGLIAFDPSGRPEGWTAFLAHNGHLQVMALVATDGVTAGALVDGILESAEARACDSVILCVRDAAPGLPEALRTRGFDVDPYRHLTTVLADVPRPSHAFDRWNGHDHAMAQLCAEAYADSPGVRAFAPGGSLAEWRQYISTLIQGTGCGWFLPELSFVVPSQTRPAANLQAGLMLSDLGTGAAHIAQVAVAPAHRGRGLGRQLVVAAMGEASRFYDHMSLLVSASNTPAGRLYESLGFRDQARFIVAAKQTPAA